MGCTTDCVTVGSVEALHERHGGPFVRTRLTEASVRAVWRLGGAVVVEQSHDRRGEPVTEPVLVCLGDPDDLSALLPQVARRLPVRPGFVTVEAEAYAGLPAPWRHAEVNRWDWMWTDSAPAPVPHEERVEPVTDATEIDALLDAANPHSHGRPADPRIRAWLGVRDGGVLVAAGALAQVPQSGATALRGVSTLPPARGRGLGAAVSAQLTRLALETAGAPVTLGVYTRNTTAVRIYRRLGFRRDRSFVSGPLRS